MVGPVGTEAKQNQQAQLAKMLLRVLPPSVLLLSANDDLGPEKARCRVVVTGDVLTD